MAEAAKPASVGVQTYARVRCFFKDRESLVNAVSTKGAKETGKKGVLTVHSSENDSVKTLKTEFTDVLSSDMGNEDCFHIVCDPLIEKVLEGYKALLIAYGQSGSGKTYSLIGAKGPGQLGLLPRTLESLLSHDDVVSVSMKGFECYSTTLQKIIIYDLFADVNQFQFEPFRPPGNNKVQNKIAENKWVQRKSAAAKALWGSKKGTTGIDTMKYGVTQPINSVEDGFRFIEKAHDASHFAKTGKNPESSRGHTVYVLKLEIHNPQGPDFNNLKTEFVVVDLAGSEGGSTLEALPDGPDKTCRFLEGGVINYGLTQLKDMFTEMRKKGKLKTSEGNGLRKMLYPFVTQNTMMSIVFTLSPSMDNIMPTRATMKFAQDACRLKMKPVRDKGKQNWKKMYDKLKSTFEEKLKLIEELESHIDEAVNEENTGIAGFGDHDVLLADLESAYQEQHERLYGIFKEYEIDKFIDQEIVADVEAEMEATKKEYVNRLRPIFKKNEPGKEQMVKTLVDQQVDKGRPLHEYYEEVCDKYKIKEKLQKREHKRFASTASDNYLSVGSLMVPGRNRGTSRAGEWRQKSILLRNKSQTLREKANINLQLLAGLEEVQEEDDEDVFSDSLDESDYDAPTDPPALKSISFNLEVEEHVFDSKSGVTVDSGFEDIDFSKPPPCLIDLGKDAKNEVEVLVKENLQNGALPTNIRENLKHKHMLSENEIDDIVTYIMTRLGNEHDHEIIENFQNEIENTESSKGGPPGAGMPSILQSEQLPLILELKSELHRLRNEHRVERTMKLWGTMRVKLRDRALKNLKKSADLHRQETLDLRQRLKRQGTNQDAIFDEMRQLKMDLQQARKSSKQLKDEVKRLRRRESLAVVESAQEDTKHNNEVIELRNVLNVERMKRKKLSEQYEALQEKFRDRSEEDTVSSRGALRKMKWELEKERKEHKELQDEVVRLRMERESRGTGEGHLRVIQSLEADLDEQRKRRRDLENKLQQAETGGGAFDDQEQFILALEGDLQREKRERGRLEAQLASRQDNHVDEERIQNLEEDLERERSKRKRLENDILQNRLGRTNWAEENNLQEFQILQDSLEKERRERQKLSAELTRIRQSGPPKAETSESKSRETGVETLSEVSTMLDDLKSDMDRFHETCKTFLMRDLPSD